MNLRASHNAKTLDAPFDDLFGASFVLRKVAEIFRSLSASLDEGCSETIISPFETT